MSEYVAYIEGNRVIEEVEVEDGERAIRSLGEHCDLTRQRLSSGNLLVRLAFRVRCLSLPLQLTAWTDLRDLLCVSSSSTAHRSAPDLIKTTGNRLPHDIRLDFLRIIDTYFVK